MKRDLLINTFILAFLAGISLVAVLISFNLSSVLVGMALVFWIGHYKKEKILMVVLCGLLLGIGRMAIDVDGWLGREAVVNQNVIVEGVVGGLPEYKGLEQEILLREVKLDDRASDKNILIKLSAFEEIQPGDRLKLSGDLLLWDDVDLYQTQKQNLFKRGAYWQLKNARLFGVEQGVWNFYQLIFVMRKVFIGQVAAILNEPAASLVIGILIGERGNMPENLSLAFQKTGLTHILAISGFNITLIINLILGFTLGMRKGWKWVVCFGAIGFFVFLTGASASVIRAAVMGILALSVKTVGRKIKALKLILLSVFIIVLSSPRIINFDLGFQLSVFATMSLVYFSDWLDFTIKRSWQAWVWESMSVTLAAQILTLPLTFYNFGKVSLISPVANLLIGPTVPLLMLLGSILWSATLILPILNWLVAGLIQVLVGIMTGIVNFLAALPLAQIEFGQGQLWLAICYYWLLFRLFRRRKLVQN